MPIVQISLVKGRDEATLKRFVKDVARTVHESLGAPMPTIRVILNEVPATHWAIGDETRDDIDAARSGSRPVEQRT
jgi:4-oxalocrotonate tautomerase